MGKRNVAFFAALGALAVVAWACERPAAPEDPEITKPLAHIFPGENIACFRLTGGGRIDKPEPPVLMPQPKNTPDSRLRSISRTSSPSLVVPTLKSPSVARITRLSPPSMKFCRARS